MAGLFSTTTLEQIRAANDIVDVIGAVLPLKRAGANFVALCPFHKERTPSFTVNPQRQIFHCFGCHKGGNVFRFVSEYENLSFPEAVRRLADRAKIPLEFESDGASDQGRFLKDALLDLHEQIAQRWQSALSTEAAGEPGRAYLAQRGLSAEATRLFRLGYAPEVWDDTVNWAKTKKLELELLEQAGLIVRREGGGFYDRFRGRLMFPICDEQGRVIAFSGRVLSSEAKAAKYVNSPETPIFTKGKVFYGLDKSKRALLERQFAIVCEGQLDLIACFTGGLQNVVAPQGTAFTADHARLLKRYVNEVVLCFDADTAGRNAAVRVLDNLLASGLAIRVASIPAPHDPDSYIKKEGPEALSRLIEGAPEFFEFYLDTLCREHDPRTDRGQLSITRAMAEALHKTGHPVLIDRYAQKTALRLSVDPRATRAEFAKIGAAARVPSAAADPTRAAPPALALTPLELWLLKILLLNDELVEWVGAKLDLEWLPHPGARRVVSLRLEAARTHSWAGPASLLGDLDDEAVHRVVTEALAEERLVPHPQQQLSDILTRLRNQFFDREIARLVQEASRASASSEERTSALRLLEERRAAKSRPLG